MKENIVITNKIEDLGILSDKIENLGEKWNMPLPIIMNINLAVEEVVSNIIFYAFSDEKKHDISISISLSENIISIVIEDDGMAFDPTIIKQPDINLPLEERAVGGLGIFLVQKTMDEVSYKREDKKNILNLMKKLPL